MKNGPRIKRGAGRSKPTSGTCSEPRKIHKEFKETLQVETEDANLTQEHSCDLEKEVAASIDKEPSSVFPFEGGQIMELDTSLNPKDKITTLRGCRDQMLNYKLFEAASFFADKVTTLSGKWIKTALFFEKKKDVKLRYADLTYKICFTFYTLEMI